MHIADVTLHYAPHSGGVRTYMDAKGQHLSRLFGYTHHMVVPGIHRQIHDSRIEVPAPPLPFIDGYRFPLRRSGIIQALLTLAPDIIEAEDPYVPAWAALEAGAMLDVPVVGFYHSDLEHLFVDRLGRAALPAVHAYMRSLYRRFDHVLAPSHVIARQLRQSGVGNVTVQPLGVDLHTFNPGHRDDHLRARLGLADNTRLLIFAGRGARGKNLPVLLQTMQLLGHGYHLLLVGSQMPRRVPGNVTVVNRFCNTETVARLLASSDALMHAGDQESFGLVALEAMASGIPVVGVNAGALPEIIPDECGVLSRPNNPASMARAVRTLFHDLGAGIGARARRHVEQHHSWDTVIASLCRIYHSLLGLSEERTTGWHHDSKARG